MSERWGAELAAAWEWREKRGFLRDAADAVRVFHGPAEGSGALAQIAVDRLGAHAWVTQWEGQRESAGAAKADARAELGATLSGFLADKGLKSAVALWRPRQGLPEEPVALFGNPPAEPFEVTESAIGAKFLVRLLGARQPGLFLDHAPLRAWLRANAQGRSVLNAFAYTGSLSVAAGLGGAAGVMTLDLSRPAIQRAQENWALNGLDEGGGEFVTGDVFEWLPRFERKDRRFDLVILDPPSFARGTKRVFSTSKAKDVRELHELAMSVLSPAGTLVTSINSASVSGRDYEASVRAAAEELSMRLEKIAPIELPETFGARGAPERGETYLKGWILRAAAPAAR